MDHKAWFSTETLNKIRVRKERNVAVNSSWTRLDKARASKNYAKASKELTSETSLTTLQQKQKKQSPRET